MNKKCIFCEFMKEILSKVWSFTCGIALGILVLCAVVSVGILVIGGLGWLSLEIGFCSIEGDIYIGDYVGCGGATLVFGFLVCAVVWIPFKLINETRKAIRNAYRNAKLKCR